MTTKPAIEEVNHPARYNAGSIECIDAIESALTPDEYRGFIKGTVLRYVWREKHKGGNQDLAKAEWYTKRLLAYVPAPANEPVPSMLHRAARDMEIAEAVSDACLASRYTIGGECGIDLAAIIATVK